MNKQLLGGVLATAMTLGFIGTAQASIIYSESFEGGPTSGFTTVSAGNYINTMQVQGGNVDWIGDYWMASDGINSLDMSGSQQGTIAKIALSVTVGNLYEVFFDMAGNPDGPPDTKSMYASVNPPLETHSFSFDSSGTSKTNMGWVTNSFTFTATQSTTDLQFGDLSINSGGGNFYGAALDNIKVVDITVPEPATLGLLSFALLGLGGLGRMKKSA